MTLSSEVVEDYQQHFVSCSEVTLHVMTAGDPQSEKAIILLHGFPEFWYGWKKVADILVDQGYYVILPDQRGYNKSDKPWGIGSYKVDDLVQDVYDLIEWTGRDKVFLGGHDWGAAVAWGMVSAHPDRVEKLIIVNVPHSKVMNKKLRSSFSQLRKSWYIFFFQLPVLPQFFLWLFNYRLLKRSLTSSSKPGTFSGEELQIYTRAWKGSLAKMINWYRAAVRRKSSISYGTIEIPVLVIWGKKDAFLSAEMATESMEYCSSGEVEYFDDATHWILHECPGDVAEKMTAFFD